HIPREVKEQIVTMSAWLKPAGIEQLTGISKRTVYRVLALVRDTSDVVRPGLPRTLNSLHVAYLESLIERTPDIYVSEIQDEFEAAFGFDVSEWMITTTL
ncbi:hypothetical protein BKA70DRAFT_1051571, partial [Coprinopsis sp. MPI-PUGE-AT-0042]